MKIINPATEETLADIPEDGNEAVAEKFRLARAAQPAWGAKPLAERVACLKRFGEILAERKAELSRTLTLETGKPIVEAENELEGARARTAYFVENSGRWLKGERLGEFKGVEEELLFDPLGVIAHISAWNYPYLVAMNVVVPALIAGNAVLYKPSECATLSGLKIREAIIASGVPADVFQAVTGAGETGRAVCGVALDGCFFTGSYATGRAIAETLAGRLIPQGFELGGKDPLYVTDDVDIPWAAGATVEGAFYNCGQSCCAVERIYVHERVYAAFIEDFTAGAKALRAGDPLDRATTLGPLTRSSQIVFLEKQVADATAKGAQILTGGKRLEQRGYFFAPTVLADTNHRMNVMREETFGPVIGLQKVRDDEEALTLMNDTEYGLTAGVFCRDRERARAVLDRVNTGTRYWNCCDRVSPRLPWSGRGHSGVGSTLSYLGILAFARPRAWHGRRLR